MEGGSCIHLGLASDFEMYLKTSQSSRPGLQPRRVQLVPAIPSLPVHGASLTLSGLRL